MPRWLVYTLLAVLCWGGWAVISRLIGDVVSAAQSQALSTLGILPVIFFIGLLAKRNPGRGGRTPGVTLGLGAGVLSCLGNIGYYYVLNSGAKAATVVPFTALYPLVTILLAVLFLRERLNGIQWLGICFSIGAIYFFNIPAEQQTVTSWLLLGCLPIVLWGISGFLQKLSTNRISGELSTVAFLAAFVPVGILILLREPLHQSLAPRIWMLSIALGASFALGNFFLLLAFASNGKASIIAPLGSLYPIVSIPLTLILFSEKIGRRESFGIAASLIAILCLSIDTPKPATDTSAESSSTT